jgi:tRNA threonylcarbamoyladenosine biosynthesis protein TsaB
MISSAIQTAGAAYPKILAIETSSNLGGVALLDGEAVRGCVLAWMAGAHSRRLLADVDELLRREELKVADLDLLVASLGPGSFTGLRIGWATIKGLSLASGVPMVGASSLLVLAGAAAACEGLVCPALDARKGELYTALYRMRSGSCEPVLPECVIAPARWLAHVAEVAQGAPVLWLGAGARQYAELLLAGSPAGSRLLGPAFDAPDPVRLALLGREQARAAGPADAAAIEPNYLRASEAELARRPAGSMP